MGSRLRDSPTGRGVRMHPSLAFDPSASGRKSDLHALDRTHRTRAAARCRHRHQHRQPGSPGRCPSAARYRSAVRRARASAGPGLSRQLPGHEVGTAQRTLGRDRTGNCLPASGTGPYEETAALGGVRLVAARQLDGQRVRGERHREDSGPFRLLAAARLLAVAAACTVVSGQQASPSSCGTHRLRDHGTCACPHLPASSVSLRALQEEAGPKPKWLHVRVATVPAPDRDACPAGTLPG